MRKKQKPKQAQKLIFGALLLSCEGDFIKVRIDNDLDPQKMSFTQLWINLAGAPGDADEKKGRPWDEKRTQKSCEIGRFRVWIL